jgi:hypothetical protein
LLLRFVSILGSGSILVTYIDADVGRGRDGCSVLLWVVVMEIWRGRKREERRAERSLNEVIYPCPGPDCTGTSSKVDVDGAWCHSYLGPGAEVKDHLTCNRRRVLVSTARQ